MALSRTLPRLALFYDWAARVEKAHFVYTCKMNNLINLTVVDNLLQIVRDNLQLCCA